SARAGRVARPVAARERAPLRLRVVPGHARRRAGRRRRARLERPDGARRASRRTAAASPSRRPPRAPRRARGAGRPSRLRPQRPRPRRAYGSAARRPDRRGGRRDLRVARGGPAPRIEVNTMDHFPDTPVIRDVLEALLSTGADASEVFLERIASTVL